MSLGTITLNTHDYEVVSTYPSVTRKCMEIINGSEKSFRTLEIAHTPGSGKKPTRTLVKLSTTMENYALADSPMSVHLVITRPSDVDFASAMAIYEETGGLLEDLLDLVSVISTTEIVASDDAKSLLRGSLL